jgi:hypothetical protein
VCSFPTKHCATAEPEALFCDYFSRGLNAMEDQVRVKIGFVAQAIGVSATTLREYEKQGRIPMAERTPTGFRVYRRKDIPLIEAAIFGAPKP